MYKFIFIKKKWIHSVCTALLISIPLLINEKSLAQLGPEEAAMKIASHLAGEWVGTIKITPTDLGPIKKFNIQMKLSNPRVDIVRIGEANAYDVLVNIAPEGETLVRSDFSAQIITAHKQGWYPNIVPVVNDFDIVQIKLASRSTAFLGVCAKEMKTDNVSILANGSWKGDIICWNEGLSQSRGTITLQHGHFDETAKSVDMAIGGGSSPSTLKQNSAAQSPESLSNGSALNKIKGQVPGFFRNIFR